MKKGIQNKEVIKRYVNPLIGFNMERCIQCGRCVKFIKRVVGDFSLAELGKSNRRAIDTYKRQLITNELSGTLADLCPAGALSAIVILYLIY